MVPPTLKAWFRQQHDKDGIPLPTTPDSLKAWLDSQGKQQAVIAGNC